MRKTITPSDHIGPAGGDVTERVFCVFNKTEESFLAMSVTRADTSGSRLRGLLGRPALKSGEGRWVVPSHGVHTIGMLFAMDVVYLDAQDRVIHLIEHLTPFRISPLRLKSASLLQLPLHTIHRSQTHVGDQLLICQPDEMKEYMRRSVALQKVVQPS